MAQIQPGKREQTEVEAQLCHFGELGNVENQMWKPFFEWE
jgi:hypothetical protein